jgi:hypothetical protein
MIKLLLAGLLVCVSEVALADSLAERAEANMEARRMENNRSASAPVAPLPGATGQNIRAPLPMDMPFVIPGLARENNAMRVVGIKGIKGELEARVQIGDDVFRVSKNHPNTASGWKLVSITPDEVTLVQKSEKRVLPVIIPPLAPSNLTGSNAAGAGSLPMSRPILSSPQ